MMTGDWRMAGQLLGHVSEHIGFGSVSLQVDTESGRGVPLIKLRWVCTVDSRRWSATHTVDLFSLKQMNFTLEDFGKMIADEWRNDLKGKASDREAARGTIEVLCYGGPEDGKVIQKDQYSTGFVVPVLEPQPVADMPKEAHYQECHYSIRKVASRHGVMYVAVAAGSDPDADPEFMRELDRRLRRRRCD